MRSEMFKAVVGDAMFGEDPAVNHFESKLASDLGFAKALFVPSGTMSNQIAIALHTKPGETILGEEFSHFFTSTNQGQLQRFRRSNGDKFTHF